MPLPPAFLDELRARLTLSEFVAKRIKLTRAGREFKGCCPFHKEKTPSFYVNDDKQFYHCFGCGAHGDIVGFAMRHDGLSFPEAIESLAQMTGLQVPKDTPAAREHYDKEKRLYSLLEEATVFFEEHLRTPQGRGAVAYLRKRKLTDDTLRQFRLGYAPDDSKMLINAMLGKGFTLAEMVEVGLIRKAENRDDHFSFFRGRVMFPVSDKRGRTIAFGARIMGEGEPKYLNSPDHALFHKGKLLYGLSRARAAIMQDQPLIVVEGYMDVIALAQAGYPGALAPLGTAMTADQLILIWRMLPRMDARKPEIDYSPILCFDGDNAGLKAAARAIERALPLLTESMTLRIAYLPSDEDPDSLILKEGRVAFDNVLAQARPMIEALWEMGLTGRRLATPEDRAAFAKAIRHKVTSIKDDSLRTLYKQEIEHRLSSLFGQTQAKFTMQSREKNFARRPSSTTAPSSLERPKSTGTRLRERILLALLINYPELFQEYSEDFLRIRFTFKELESIRQEVVAILMDDSHETLDGETLYRHLSVGAAAKGMEKKLADLLSEATYVHAGFARPKGEIEQAQKGWKSIWNKYLQENLQAELQTASQQWHVEPSNSNLSRMMALREQMEKLIAESAEQDLLTETH
ncbi:MAG: DNA primase [Alphaproteobacteria bacterium]|jgi:DNA primase|nr:DNA primase [Alphaproteobacteria bacterium]